MKSEPTRVLYVCGEATALGEITKRILERPGLFQVTVARSPLEVIPLLRQGGFDVVLSKICMAEMDGCELSNAVRQEFPDLPFGFVTGRQAVDRKIVERRALLAPADPEDLIELIKELLLPNVRYG